MSTITQIVDPYTKVPTINSPSTFEEDVDVFLNEINDRVTQTNTQSSQMNIVAGEVNLNATSASGSAISASLSALSASSSASYVQSVANNKGAWSGLTGTLNIPASVNHNGYIWVLNVNLVDVTLSEPTSINTDWTQIGISQEDLSYKLDADGGTMTNVSSSGGSANNLTLNFPTINNPNITGSIKEETYTLTSSSGAITLDATNGTIQSITLTENITSTTDSLTDGQSITLIISAGDTYTFSFPTTTWNEDSSGTAPTLSATLDTTIVFVKVGSELRGYYRG